MYFRKIIQSVKDSSHERIQGALLEGTVKI